MIEALRAPTSKQRSRAGHALALRVPARIDGGRIVGRWSLLALRPTRNEESHAPLAGTAVHQ